tara:strand:+ start:647 stop:814 length:168 start_codon:yes stop_codon:yes gene_type:complete
VEKKISKQKLTEENRLLKEEIKKLHNRIKHLEHAYNWANARRGSFDGIGGFGRNN